MWHFISPAKGCSRAKTLEIVKQDKSFLFLIFVNFFLMFPTFVEQFLDPIRMTLICMFLRQELIYWAAMIYIEPVTFTPEAV